MEVWLQTDRHIESISIQHSTGPSEFVDQISRQHCRNRAAEGGDGGRAGGGILMSTSLICERSSTILPKQCRVEVRGGRTHSLKENCANTRAQQNGDRPRKPYEYYLI